MATKKVDIEAEVTKQVETVKQEIKQDYDQKLEDSTAKITEKATADARQSLADALSPKSQGDTAWEKEGRQPKDHSEVAEEGARIAEERIEKKRLEREAEAEKVKEEANKAQAEKTKKSKEDLYAFVDKGLDELETEGSIPAMSDDVKDLVKTKGYNLTGSELTQAQEDSGFKARVQLQKLGVEHKSNHMGFMYLKHFNKQSGADAPVMGSRKSVPSSNNEDFALEDLVQFDSKGNSRVKSMSEIMEG